MRHHVRSPTSTPGSQIQTDHYGLLDSSRSDIRRRSHRHIHRMSSVRPLLAGSSKSRYSPFFLVPSKVFQTNQRLGTCSKGIIQLEVFSALNMATDVMLIALPLPNLIKIQRPFWERLRLVALFLVGLTIVAVTMTRLLMNVVFLHRSGQSHNVANVELFFEAFVANAPTIYGLLDVERRRRMNTGGQYLPDSSYVRSRSGGGLGSNLSKNRGDLDSSRFQPGESVQSKAWGGKSKYVNDSDEEMMIVSPSFRCPALPVLFYRIMFYCCAPAYCNCGVRSWIIPRTQISVLIPPYLSHS